MDVHAISQLSDKHAAQTKRAARGNNQFSNELTKASKKTTTLDAIFNKAAATYHVDVNLLKSMAKAESEFHADSTSRCGAKGIMQLMPATTKYLGVKDAYDPEQSIMGGAKYISRLLKQYNGNVDLALAAYNAGSGNVRKYGGIPPFKETQNYVRKIRGFMKTGVTIPSHLNVVENKSGTDYSKVPTSTAATLNEPAAQEATAYVKPISDEEPIRTEEVNNNPDDVAILSLSAEQEADLLRLEQELSTIHSMELLMDKLDADQNQVISESIQYNRAVLELLTGSDEEKDENR
ncbi:Transglycosylase SLT domain-containing protein [Lachnospiraceae bacterium XBB1006]|nr:Transglycosylase SLT domain-containing protein [Lachnospiraceae bacterium XBB1006]